MACTLDWDNSKYQPQVAQRQLPYDRAAGIFEAQEQLFKSLALGAAGAAVVPQRTTYTNAARCLTVVHFLDERLASVIAQDLISPLRTTEGHHY